MERPLASPALAAFVEVARPRFVRDGAEAIWACRDDLARLLATPFVAEVVAWDLANALARPTEPLRDSSRFLWSVHRDPAFELNVLAIATADERIGYLYGAPHHRLIAGWGPARVGLYRHATAHAPDVFDRSAVLSALGERALGAGEILELRAWRDVCDPLPSPGAFLIELASAPVDRVRWTYDRATLAPHTPTPAVRASNLIEFAVWTVLELGHPAPLPALRRVAEHPSHHVRWTALRAAAEADPEAALALLEAAAEDDPHPHVRNAARRGLERLREERSRWR